MNNISFSSILWSPQQSSTRLSLSSSIFKRSSLLHQSHSLSQTLAFCIPKSLPNSLGFSVSFKSRKRSTFSVEPQLSDADEEDVDDEYEDDDDDDDVAADEYDDVSGDLSEGLDQSEDEIEFSVAANAETETTRAEEFKWQRVEKFRNEVREFGEEIIDADELASVYDFRIDKFQVKLDDLYLDRLLFRSSV